MTKELTEKQAKFIELLYADGLPEDIFKKANEVKTEAGYGPTVSASQILRMVKDEIIKINTEYMALHSNESIVALQKLVRMPTLPGGDTLIKAANSLLDRSGFGKKETQEVEIKADKGIVILPAKIQVTHE